MDNKNLQNHFDEAFKQRLYDHEVAPPPLLFEQIKTQIALQNPTTLATAHSHNFWQKYKIAFLASALSLMLGAFLSSIYWVKTLNTHAPQKNQPTTALKNSTSTNFGVTSTNLSTPSTASATPQPLNTADTAHDYTPQNTTKTYTNNATLAQNKTQNINNIYPKKIITALQIPEKKQNTIQFTNLILPDNNNNVLAQKMPTPPQNLNSSTEITSYPALPNTLTSTEIGRLLNVTSKITNTPPLPSLNRIVSALPTAQPLLPAPPTTTAYKTNKDPYKQPTKTTGLHAGYFATLNNTWIVNPQAMKISKNRLNYKLDFGRDYGFNIGYDFNEKIGVQAEYIVNSWQGQKYQYQVANLSSLNPISDSKKTVNTDINLRYTAVPLLFKYHVTNDKKTQPRVLNYSAGIEWGMLKSAEININNAYLHHDLLKKYTWGINLGIDYDLYLTRNYYFSIGTHAKLTTTTNSITEINLPTKFNSNNILMGIRAGLNYRFK